MNARPTFTPTVRQLRAFRAVYHLGKLSAAAEQLALTQSGVSVLIRQLEEGLGTRLFERTTRSLRPTTAGVEALGYAERILRDVDALGAGMRDLAGLRHGRVTVAVTPTLGEILLPRVVARFRRAHPAVRIVIDDCAPDQFVARIVGEQVDLGIGAPERAAADVDTHRLLADTLAVVCPRDHAFARRRHVRWADLAGQPVITVRRGYGIRPLVDAAAVQAGIVLDVVNDVTFLSSALWMVESGLGVAVMPSAYARGGRPGLAVRKLQAPVVSRDISLVTKRGRTLPAAAQALADVVRAELGGKEA